MDQLIFKPFSSAVKMVFIVNIIILQDAILHNKIPGILSLSIVLAPFKASHLLLLHFGYGSLNLSITSLSKNLLTGGGIIPPDDMKSLNEMGVGKLFPPGTPTGEISEYIREWVKTHRNF